MRQKKRMNLDKRPIVISISDFPKFSKRYKIISGMKAQAIILTVKVCTFYANLTRSHPSTAVLCRLPRASLVFFEGIRMVRKGKA
jgi:hypothetical protein